MRATGWGRHSANREARPALHASGTGRGSEETQGLLEEPGVMGGQSLRAERPSPPGLDMKVHSPDTLCTWLKISLVCNSVSNT